MATKTDEIVVKLRAEGGDEVAETFKKTADASDHFHQKVTKAGGALGDLRLKSEARVANNLGSISQALTGGANAGEVFATSITKASESLRGSLLFSGAATVGLGLYQIITKAGEAAIALESDLLKLRRSSLSTGDFLGVDAVNQNLDTAISKIDELFTRYKREHTGIFGRIEQAPRTLASLLTGQGGRSAVEARDAEQAKELLETGLRLLDQSADKQSTLNDLVREGLSGDERKAALDKAEADHKERAARIAALEARLGVQGVTDAQAAEQSRFELEQTAINKRFEQQKFELDLARDLARVQTEFLQPAHQALDIAQAQEKSLESQLRTLHFLTTEERQRLNTAKESSIAAETRAVVGRATSPLYRFNAKEDHSVNARLLFEQEKLAANPFAADNADRIRHIKELQLYQDTQRLNDLNDVRANTINYGAGGRVLDANQEEQARNLRSRVNATRKSLGLRAIDEQGQDNGDKNAPLINQLNQLIQTLNALPTRIGVG